MEVTVEELTNYANLSPESRARFIEVKQEEKHEQEVEDKKKNSPFANWLQVNNTDDLYKAEDWLIKKSPIAYRVLRFLAKQMDNYNAIICSFSSAVKLLKEHNYIDVKKSGTTNVYLINKQLYWKSWGKNHRFAEFGAKIIISEAEQESKIETKKNKSKSVVQTPKGKVKTTTQTTVTAEKPVADTEVKEKFTEEELKNNVTTTDPEVVNNTEVMDTIQTVKDHYLYEDLADALAKLA